MNHSFFKSEDGITDTDISTVLVDSDEWLIIEYLLQLCTRTSRVKLKVARQIYQQTTINLFEKRSIGCTVALCFIEASKEGENSVSAVCRRGFKIRSNGMKISLGNFSLPGFPLMRPGGQSLNAANDFEDPYVHDNDEKRKKDFIEAAKTELLTGERRIFDFFLCEVAIGQSYVVENELEASGMRNPLPKNFDSCFIKHSNKSSILDDSLTVHYLTDSNMKLFKDENEAIGNQSSVNTRNFSYRNLNLQSIISATHLATPGVLPEYTFKHEYIIYDSSQILPRYLLQIECNPSGEELFSVPLCDDCQDDVATEYCNADKARLCKSCSDRLHSSNKTTQRHIRVSLIDIARPFGKCKYHKEFEYELFCNLCQLPTCRLCVPNHTHTDILKKCYLSDKINSLIPIKNAYQSILKEIEEPHLVLEKRKEDLKYPTTYIQSLINDVRQNFLEVEQKCYTICEEATQQLHRRTEEKMSFLWSYELEKSRQFNELEWAESFLEYLKSVLPPPDFLMAWIRHCRLRAEMENGSFSTNKLSDNIFADMQLEGKVEVLLESFKTHQEEAHQHKIKN